MASVSAFRYQSDANNDVSQAADLESSFLTNGQQVISYHRSWKMAL